LYYRENESKRKLFTGRPPYENSPGTMIKEPVYTFALCLLIEILHTE
jgi:hypothetical protein